MYNDYILIIQRAEAFIVFTFELLCKTENENGYFVLEIKAYRECKEPLALFNGVFSAKNYLYKITKELELCEKVNGISEANIIPVWKHVLLPKKDYTITQHWDVCFGKT